jgi:hypothetical protein
VQRRLVWIGKGVDTLAVEPAVEELALVLVTRAQRIRGLSSLEQAKQQRNSSGVPRGRSVP